MKKIIAGIVATVMTMSMCTFNAFAANESVSIDFEQSSYAVSVGEEFEVDLDVTDNENGFNNVSFKIKYDPTVIEPVEIEENADGIMTYDSMYGVSVPLIDYGLINTQIGRVDNGVIKLNALITEFDENNALLNMEGTGRLFGMKFRAVADGETTISIAKSDSTRFGDTVTAVTISGCETKVVVGSGNGGSSDSEETTVTATETTETTTVSSSSSSNSSSSGSGAGSSSSATESTTEEDTEETTEVTTEESTTELTTSDVRLFNDIEQYPWAVSYIESLAKANVINGYSDGSFKPANNIKRADFIIMLMKTIGEDITAQKDGFTDVDVNAYYANAVNTAKALGIASGNGDGTFSPSSEITRQDMMILAKKALEYKTGGAISGDVSVLDKFADKDSISAYAKESLAAMVQTGLVNGTGNNIEPKANTTRAQAAVVMSKIYEEVK